MKLTHFDNPSVFYDQVKDYLLQHEGEHNLLLGVIQSLINDPNRYESQPYLVTVEKEQEIIGVAMRTPPYGLLLSKMVDLDAAKVIVQDLYHHQSIPAVSSFPSEAKAFSEVWKTLTGQSAQLTMDLLIHKLIQVQPIPKSLGFLRLATESDRAFLIQWHDDFTQEVMHTTPINSERIVDSNLSQNSLYIWENIVPVSMAAGKGFPPNGGRIGPVYTPPNYRKKGYASSCVAALSQKLLNQGCRACFLFTDKDNPTSNHIYQMIGYQPICDWHEYSFNSKEYSQSI